MATTNTTGPKQRGARKTTGGQRGAAARNGGGRGSGRRQTAAKKSNTDATLQMGTFSAFPKYWNGLTEAEQRQFACTHGKRIMAPLWNMGGTAGKQT